jgi:hypothetical protein
MHNWSTDITRLKKNSPKYDVWQLEQQLNFGLGETEKIDKKKLAKYLPILAIDQDTKNFLEFILYDKKPSNTTSA